MSWCLDKLVSVALSSAGAWDKSMVLDVNAELVWGRVVLDIIVMLVLTTIRNSGLGRDSFADRMCWFVVGLIIY